MTKTTRPTVGAAVVVVALWSASPSSATESRAAVAAQPGAGCAGARGDSAACRGHPPKAPHNRKRSAGWVDRIGITDGIVYVAEGPCGQGLQACLLLTMTIAGSHRLLRILVDPRNSDRFLMESIGHEPQMR